MSNKKVVAAGDPPTFNKARLIAQAAQLFKQPPEVMAGALHSVTKPITIDQAKEKLNEFLARPIQNKGGK